MNQTPKPSDRKINKMLYIVTVTLLFAIAVVIALTTAASRREKTPAPQESTDSRAEESIKAPEDTAPITTDRSKDETKKPPEEPKKPETDAIETEETPSAPVSLPPPEMTLPTVGILSKGHDPELQVFSATMNDYRTHVGIDIVTEAGAPVYASADGTVSQIWDDPLMGRCIAISHSGDCYSVYKNLSAEGVSGIEEGADVKGGQLIASVGESAMIEIAEEPHLHFEVTVDGKSADPLEFFSDSALVSLTVDASFES